MKEKQKKQEKNKQRQERARKGGGAEAIVKGSELNDFVAHLS